MERPPKPSSREKKPLTPDDFLMPVNVREDMQVRWGRYAEAVTASLNDQELFLDRGGAAEVFAFGTSGFCLKLIENRHASPYADKMNLGNPIDVEADFLRRMTDINVKGARVPCFVDTIEGERHGVLVMEQLPAVNMQRVLSGEQPLPEAFDYHRFFDALEAFISHMHDVMHVAHGDLYARNVMCDVHTGLPYVIDFGRAIDLSTLNEDRREKTEEVDWKRVENLAVQCEKLTQK